MTWTIKKKMFGMGLGVLIALAMLAGMNFISYRAVGVAMDKGTSRIKQMETAMEMKSAQL